MTDVYWHYAQTFKFKCKSTILPQKSQTLFSEFAAILSAKAKNKHKDNTIGKDNVLFSIFHSFDFEMK